MDGLAEGLTPTFPVAWCGCEPAMFHAGRTECVQVGMHFMHPVWDMPLVELARGMHTSSGTFLAAKSLAESLGKQVAVSSDRPVSEFRGGGWVVHMSTCMGCFCVSLCGDFG
jgi:hypothetical protein